MFPLFRSCIIINPRFKISFFPILVRKRLRKNPVLPPLFIVYIERAGSTCAQPCRCEPALPSGVMHLTSLQLRNSTTQNWESENYVARTRTVRLLTKRRSKNARITLFVVLIYLINPGAFLYRVSCYIVFLLL